MSIPGKFGFGTMSMTWTPKPVPLEDAIATMYYSCLKYNIRFLNGGEFYGPNKINLQYLAAFWEKYQKEFPDLVVSIKGAIDTKTLTPDGSKESIDKGIASILEYFPQSASRPKLIFEIARVDPKVPYDETIGYIKAHVDSGAIDGISLSEVGVGSIQKALAVAPIECVEVEFSLICQDIFQDGVLKELSEKNVTVVAYSPLGRGFLTDRTANDFDSFYNLCHREGDIRGYIDKFSEKNYKHNTQYVAKLQEFAHKKGMSLEALALSWILSVSGQTDFQGIKKVTKIVPIPSGSTPEKVDANLGSLVVLDRADLDEITAIGLEFPIKGYRYNEAHADNA